MENITDLISKRPRGSKMAFSTKNWGVLVNPNLAAGLVLATSLLGLGTYIWALWYQRGALSLFKRSFFMSFSCEHVNLRGVQNIHVSLFALIFIDVLNVIGAIIYGSYLAAAVCEKPCLNTGNLWMVSRQFLVVIHLLTALISLLYLYRPDLGAKLRCVFSVVSLLICVLRYSSVIYGIEAQYMLEALICGLALAIFVIVGYRSAARERKKEKLLIMTVAMCTFLVVYFPSFVLLYLLRDSSGQAAYDYQIIYTNVYYFTNFQVFLDGLLCCLILKLSAAEEDEGKADEEPKQWELQPPQHWQQQQPQQQQWQQQQPQHQWQQQQPQQQWQQQQPQQQWQQQPPQQQLRQQPQRQGLDYPKFHVNRNAVTAYNRDWN